VTGDVREVSSMIEAAPATGPVPVPLRADPVPAPDSLRVDVPIDRAVPAEASASAFWTAPVPVKGEPAGWWSAVFAAFLYRYGGAGPVTVLELTTAGTDAARYDCDETSTVDSMRAAARRETVAVELHVAADEPGVLAGLAEATPPAWLDLAVVPGPDGAMLHARSGRWTAESTTRMARHLTALATGARSGADRPVAELPLLDADDREQLLVRWNRTAVDWPGDDYLSLLRGHAERTPDAPAIVHGDVELSFAELERRTNQMAHRLLSLGAGAGHHVGVLAGRSAEYVVAVLGILKTGAAAVPLDPANPDPRLAYMVADSAPLAVLVAPALAERTPDGVPALPIDEATYAGEPDSPPAVVVPPDGVSHLIYTSGSTGQPKAVLERHAAVVNLVHWTARAYGVREGDRASWLSTPGFAVQIMEWMPYLGLGVAVHIGDPAEVDTPDKVAGWLVEHGITHTMLVAALAERCWGLTWPDETRLRVMVTTAERVHSWPSADRPFTVVMTYGATETTNVLTCLDLGADIDLTARATPAAVRAVRPVPAGRPIANLRVYLLDQADQPVPVGVVGRLHVAGAGLAAGYHDRPELTAAKFRPNPLPEEPSAVLYDTGDLARFRADGAVEILGRSDSQVKVRGYRVELGEVETAIAALDDVREVVVVAREDTSGRTGLVAYVAGPDRPAADLRAALSERLPHYMVPGAVVVLGELPRLPNGKTDLRALPPARTGERDESFVAPRDALETGLARLWAPLLGVSEVGVHDNFFDLGGHSLLAFRLIDEVRRTFAVELSLPDLMRHPSVAALAEVIGRRRDSGPADFGGVPAVTPDPARRFEPFPLNDSQQALWIGRGDAVELGNVGCHGYFEWESPLLDVERFGHAWQRLVDRHDALRTVIRPDGVQQVLADPPPYDIPVLDVRGADEATVAAALGELRERLSHLVMQENKWPLVDVRLSLLPPRAAGEQRVRIHLSIDMLIADAWSYFQVLIPDLVQLYEAPEQELKPLELTFRDYVVELDRDLPASEIYHRSQRYWMERLADLPPAPQLPARPAWQPEVPLRFERVAHRLTPQQWAQLKRNAQDLSVTPSGVLTAVFAEVLRAWSGQDRFTINFPLFNRVPVHPEVNRIIGDTTTTLLVAVEKSDGTFAERARALQDRLWADLEHRFFSGVQVLRELARLRGNVSAAMPIVLTSLLGHPPRRYATSLGEAIYSISQTPQVSIDFQIFEIAGELQFNWDFLPSLFPAGLVEDMFDAYCRVLHELSGPAEAWQRETFDLLPPAQRALRAKINDTDAPVRDVLLHELLAARAAERPDAVAVVSGGRRLPYAELADRATALGHALRSAGARPNRLVGVVMDKGWQQIAAVYGVLASGAAYLPIDARVPQARLHKLLAGGEVEVVLTQPWLVDKVVWPDGVEVLVVEDEPPAPAPALPSVQRPADLAYVLFTSGSVGEPKGVMVDHRAVVNHVDDVNRRLGIGPDVRAMGTAALHFDMSVYDVFGILAAGGTLVLPEPGERPDPDHWLDVVRAERVTFWAAVPPLMELAVDRAEARAAGDLESVRAVVLAGDWIPLTLPDRLRAQAPEVTVIGSGGPTETVNWSVWNEIGAVDPAWPSIPYGVSMANHRYLVLDEQRRERPLWVTGEMYDASEVGLAQGYWHDPERTEQAFVRLPGTGERAYATGDLGRYLPDGSIEILGRADFQVKVQGHRIELGEVEAALRSHPAVAAAVVVAVGAHAQRHLVAHVVLEPGAGLALDALRAHLAEQLPAPMVPGRYVRHDRLPLSGNGKVDRKALMENSAAPAEREPATEAADRPMDALERVVAGVWQEVLQSGPLGPAERFFDLGGNSMLAALLARRVSELFAVDLSLRAVFDLATVAEMAAALRSHPERGEQIARRAAELDATR
jgi:yersiniabactin nonribosomal peptide synthetase